MKKVKIAPKATIVSQINAGNEVSAVIDESGVLYLPVIDINNLLVDSTTPPKGSIPTIESTKTSAKATKTPTPKKTTTTKKVVKSKNELIIDVLNGIDDGSIEEGKEVEELSKIIAHNKTFLEEVVNKFLDNPDLSLEDVAKEIEEGPKATAPKKKGRTAKAKAKVEEKPTEETSEESKVIDEEISIDDLEVGDVVNVYWEEYQDFYKGSVEKIVKGKRYVKYEEDGEVEVLDPKVNTKIIYLGAL